MTSFRLIPEIDKSDRAANFAQTVLGKCVILTIFAVGVWLHGRDWWVEITVALAVMTFLPAYRRQILLAATVFWLWRFSPLPWPTLALVEGMPASKVIFHQVPRMIFWAAQVGAAIVFFGCYLWAAKEFNQHRLFVRPVRTLLVAYCVFLILAGQIPDGNLFAPIVWGFLIVFGVYLWFFGYSLIAIGTQHKPFFLQVGHYHPFWMLGSGSLVPYAKGDTYLSRIEARDAEQLAVTQLKGVKLLYWALVLVWIQALFDGVFYSSQVSIGSTTFASPLFFEVESFESVFQKSIAGNPAVWYENWLALICRFFGNLISLAIFGHVVIAVCRMAGFRALRNTYKPLRSATIAEFWNRYYYYFKELLVDFFFYPTYLRYFKRWPRVRLFVATMAAATFGNILYHFLRDISYILKLGFWDALLSFSVYAVYGLILGAAIGASQLRNQSRQLDRDSFRSRVVAPTAVILFYCVLSVFLERETRDDSLSEYFKFLMELVPGNL